MTAPAAIFLALIAVSTILAIVDVAAFNKVMNRESDRIGFDAWRKSKDRWIAFMPFGAIYILLRDRKRVA